MEAERRRPAVTKLGSLVTKKDLLRFNVWKEGKVKRNNKEEELARKGADGKEATSIAP